MKEEITFVIPAYNAEQTLSRTLESIVHQTNQRYKVIIVNDGSKDFTEKICLKYVHKYTDKIKYMYQENKGPGGARNLGMQYVDTRYVMFLDSDDWLMPEFVENVIKYISGQEEPEMIMVLPEIFHEESKAILEWYDKKLFEEIFTKDGIIVNPQNELRVYQFAVNMCRKILSIKFIEKTNFLFRDEIRWEDVYPHYYLLSKCSSCMGIKSVGFYYRIGASDQCTSSRGSVRLDFLGVFDEMVNYACAEKNENLYFPVMRELVRFSYWCIKMSDMNTRKKMTIELHKKFKKLPRKFYVALRKGSKNAYSKADAKQYTLFMIAIRYRVFNFIFYDYLWQELCVKGIKKVLKANERVA